MTLVEIYLKIGFATSYSVSCLGTYLNFLHPRQTGHLSGSYILPAHVRFHPLQKQETLSVQQPGLTQWNG